MESLMGFIILFQLAVICFLGYVIFRDSKTVDELQVVSSRVKELVNRFNVVYTDICQHKKAIDKIDEKLDFTLDKCEKAKNIQEKNRFMSLKEVFTAPGINERS